MNQMELTNFTESNKDSHHWPGPYVGLPLAASNFGPEKYKTVGYDINPSRVDPLQKGHDRTLEVADEEL